MYINHSFIKWGELMINSLYLIDKSNDLPPEPGQIKCSDVKSIQHDYTTSRVVETLQ